MIVAYQIKGRAVLFYGFAQNDMDNISPDQTADELLDMAAAQRRLGIMDEPTFRKITVRHLGHDAPLTAEPTSGEEIRRARASRPT
jgi:hypothetical protein